MKQKEDSKVLKTSIIYIIVSFINKGIGIITVPIFTRLLTADEMGTVTTWISWMTILMPITCLSLTSASFYIAMNEYSNRRDEYQSSVLSLSTISCAICILIYVIFRNWFNKLFTLTTPQMIFMFIYLMFVPGFDMWMLKQRYEYSVKKMAIISLVSNLSASILAVVLVLLLRKGSYNLGNVRIYAT